MGEQSKDLDAFMQAAKRGDVERIAELAAANPNFVSAYDNGAFGSTALIHAVWHDQREAVDLLLSLGAEIDQRSKWWAGSFGVLDHGTDAMCAYLLERRATLTPHAAARLGMIEQLRAMVQDDPGVVHERGGDGQMALHFARTPEIADLLLEAGAEIDAVDLDHASTAAQWRCTEVSDVARHLVARGAQADPFMAVMMGDAELLDRVIEAEPEGVQVRLTRNRFPTQEPAAGHIYLFNIGEGCSLLHAAALGGHAELVRLLVDRGLDINARGGYDDATPLHVAAWHDRAGVIRELADAGAELELASGEIHENEALGWAIVSGAVSAVEALIGVGAEVNEHHREQAAAGARGEFQEFNRARDLSAWVEVTKLIGGVG